MALNELEKNLIDDLADKLHTRYDCEMSKSKPENSEINKKLECVSSSLLIPVAITKEDLRANSGRKITRDIYLTEVATALSQKSGVAAHVDLSKGIVYAYAVHNDYYNCNSMSILELNNQAKKLERR